VCHSWAVSAGTTSEAALRELVDRLGAARDAAAAIVGRPPLGVRAVESRAGRRGYLCAFPGPAFLCLTAELGPETDAGRVREAASASLIWEHLEAMVDAAALRDLAAAIGRLLALGGDPPEVARALETVADRALALTVWREDPGRALASVPDIDEASALHERLWGAYARFVRASEPLVGMQEGLDPRLVEALRDVEEHAARAGAAERLAERLAGAMPECAEGADQVVAAHLARLGEP
jgi:hypothetical protein